MLRGRAVYLLRKSLVNDYCKNIVFINVRYVHDEHDLNERMLKIINLRKTSSVDFDPTKLETNNKVDRSFQFVSTMAPTAHSFSALNVVKWAMHKLETDERAKQGWIPERYEILGNDLAVAHIIVHRGGKVKFVGQSEWITNDKDSIKALPKEHDPKYILEKVDAHGVNLFYEGFDHFTNLYRLKWLSLKGCENIDDWCLDKISAELPSLEYLDISDCEKITERGLESLYRMFNLNTLIVTNHYKSSAFELTCLMLEECLPQLTCEILEPKEETLKSR